MIDYMEEKEMTLMFLLKDMEMILSGKEMYYCKIIIVKKIL